MHRTIGYLSKRLIQIHPGEGRKVLLTFLYFFLIITAYYLIKPASRSLILGELGSRMVPYVDLVAALLMGPLVTLFARLVDRMPKPRLVSGSFWAVIGVLVLFWKLLAWSSPWIAGVFYIWVAIFSVLVVTLFWLVANDLYRPREAKRLFGFIGSGGILGGVVGSSIAALGAKLIGTENLLLLSAGVLFACWIVVQQLWACVPERTMTHEETPRDTFLADPWGFARLLLRSRYLLLLVAMVGLNKLVATLIYYQLNPFIEQAFPDQDARTSFMGMFLSGMNLIAFLVQFFFTSFALRRLGVFVALLALPAGLLTGTMGLLIMPTFWLAAVTELYDGSMNYSLQQTTKEVLYLPIGRSVRYKVKPFIDMVVFRFGKGIAAILGIVLLNMLHAPPRALSAVVFPLLLVWLVVAVWLHRDYVARIRTVLQARAAARVAEWSLASPDLGRPVTPSQTDLVASFGLLTAGPPSARKLALLDELVLKGELPELARALVAELAAYETGSPQAQGLEGDRLRLHAIIADPHEPMAARRRAIRALSDHADQTTVDYLCGVVMVQSDAGLRHEAVRGLLRLRLMRRRLEFPVRSIRRQIAHEVANFQRISEVAAIYRQHHSGSLMPEDPILALLRVLAEESIEQVFRLLMFLYRPEDIHLVYEQLRVPELYVRADAIELLDNLIDPAMRSTIAPLLDEDWFLARLEERPDSVFEPSIVHQSLQQAIWDHNCWLSVTTLCAVGELRLTSLRPELEKASQHTTSLVSSAAKFALHLVNRP